MDRSEAYACAQAYANRRQREMHVVYNSTCGRYDIATPSDMEYGAFDEWEVVSTAEPQQEYSQHVEGTLIA